VLPSQTWPDFLAELQQDILPLYLHHEQTFDHRSVHGRMHICRAVLFAEWMCRYYVHNTAFQPDVAAVRYAIAFHDAGREGNGWDRWEHVSARLCREYLEGRLGSAAAQAVGELIDKDIPGEWGLEKRIVQDADVLEIMRVTSLLGFLKSELRFLSPRDATGIRNPQVRSALIGEAWKFIQVTEKRKPMLMASEDTLQGMLAILAEPQVSCPMLRESLCEPTS
jgi:hypothetical protein